MITHEGKTKQEWLDWIAEQTVDSIIGDLLARIFPGAIHSYEGEPSYNNLRMVNKPPRELFVFELGNYKADREAEILEIFDHLELLAQIEPRIAALQYPAYAAEKASGGKDGRKELKRIRNEGDLDGLALVEAADALLIQESADRDAANQARQNLKDEFDAIDWDANLNANDLKEAVRKMAELLGLI